MSNSRAAGAAVDRDCFTSLDVWLGSKADGLRTSMIWVNEQPPCASMVARLLPAAWAFR